MKYQDFFKAVLPLSRMGVTMIVLRDEEWEALREGVDAAHRLPGQQRTEVLYVHGVNVVSETTRKQLHDRLFEYEDDTDAMDEHTAQFRTADPEMAHCEALDMVARWAEWDKR